MEFRYVELHRVDLLQVAATQRQTLAVMPAGSSGSERVIVGDSDGGVVMFSVKKQDTQTIFKAKVENSIQHLTLGGKREEKDKIFVAAGAKVVGINKKGRTFFEIDTNLTEKIQAMFVEDVTAWTAGQYIVSTFVDGIDKGSFISKEMVNDLTCSMVGGHLYPVLACHDSAVRILKDNTVWLECAVDGPATTVENARPGVRGQDDRVVLYGTQSGKVAALAVTDGAALRTWTSDNPDKRGSILCMATYDLLSTADGKPGEGNLIVGRDDGMLEVYECRPDGDPPQRLFDAQLSESVTSVAGGHITLPEVAEVILSTFSGRVICYTPDSQDQLASVDGTLLAKTKGVLEKTGMRRKDVAPPKTKQHQRISNLKQEIYSLQAQVAKEREKFAKHSSQMVAPSEDVMDKFVLNPEDASYTLVVEISTPIDMVVLRADVAAELVDVDRNVAICSRTPAPADGSSKLLATYRCQENIRRLEMKVRSAEGQYGTLSAYVIPKVEPKTCQLRHYNIKPLSLHQRVSQLAEPSDRMNELTLRGTFSLGELHAWVGVCLPDIPDRTPAEAVVYYFRSTFLGTLLVCDLRQGLGIFRSDNISTIAIIKEVLSREATARKTPLKIDFSIKEDSIAYVLRLLHPKLEYQLSLATRVKMMDALKELQMQEEDTSYLPEEFRETIENAEQITREFKQQPMRLEFIFDQIRDLYVHKHKFRGQDAAHRVPVLVQVLHQEYDPAALLDFFNAPLY